MGRLANAQVVLDGVALLGHFKAPYGQAFGGIATAEPVLTLADADVTTATQASVAQVDGVTYRVRSLQRTGGGLTRLLLERQ